MCFYTYFKGDVIGEITDIGFSNVDQVIDRLVGQLPKDIPIGCMVQFRARRIVDFISGGVYALDGYIQKVSNSIFLVAPSNYEITNDMGREEMRNKLSVSWLKNNNLN